MTTRLLANLVLLVNSATLFAQERQDPLASSMLTVSAPSEVIATLTARCEPCDWAVAGRESVLLEVRVDGQYSQHVVLVRGRERSDYRVLLGRMSAGEHHVTVARDTQRSAVGAGQAVVERLAFATIAPGAPDFEWISRAPFLRARPGSVERFSDVPLVMYAERNAGSEGPAPYDVQYTVIFTNEDGGTPTDRLMATWGRTTDIEFVYGVTAAHGTQPPSEIIQVEGHRWVDFSGPRRAGHPELWVATDNNMVADHGADDLIRFAPAPVLVDVNGISREKVMDDEPWTYAATSAEMLREGRVTRARPDGTGKMADPRHYAVVEACAEVSDATLAFEIAVRGADGQLTWHSSDLGLPAFRIARSGCFRGGAPLPDSASSSEIAFVRLRAFDRPTRSANAPAGRVVLRRVNQLLILDATFHPIRVGINWTGTEPVEPGGDGFAVPVPTRR